MITNLNLFKSFYSINAPGTIKSNRKYSVVLALHEASESCSIRITVEGPNFNDTKEVTLQPYESKLIDFLPNKLITGDYTLKAEGISGLRFENSSRIYAIGTYGPKIYIQTDKAIYKPQDIVRFRVVLLDEHTRPLHIEEPISVDILVSDYKCIGDIQVFVVGITYRKIFDCFHILNKRIINN